MEDPICIEVWGRPISDRTNEALALVRAQEIFPSELELRKAMAKALRENALMRISPATGFNAARSLADSASGSFATLTFCQEGWTPGEAVSYCEQHNLHFGGCTGCHVCAGFYVT